MIEKHALEMGKRHGSFILDGECIGDRLYAFDILAMNGEDVRGSGYGSRIKQLHALVGSAGAISTVDTARTATEKRMLCKALRDQQREGVVFKQHEAPYKAGRPNGGGSQLKYKFYATASLIVAKTNTGKRSIAMQALEGKDRVEVGNVTIPPNAAIPAPGSIIEVRYLYAYRGGSLFQPTFLGVRTDVDVNACTAAQLKFRAEDEDDDQQ